MLTIDVEKNGEVAVVHCSGRLVRGVEVCSLKTAVVSQKTTRIVMLDLSQVEFMDAGGLNALVSLHNWAHSHGIQLKLVKPSGLVREMLTRTHLNRLFDMSSLRDAMAILSGVDCHHAKFGAGYPSPMQALAAK
ncbi:MAG: STAS domain-containing protein [Terriglobales bacterium]